jgi:hypothetical protein
VRPGQNAEPGGHASGRTALELQQDRALDAEAPKSAWLKAFGATGLDLNGGPGGGYTLNGDDLDGVVNDWSDALERARSFDQYTVNFVRMITAADDEASTMFTRTALAAARDLVDSNASLKAYMISFLSKLEATRQAYRNTERNNAGTLPSLPPGK